MIKPTIKPLFPGLIQYPTPEMFTANGVTDCDRELRAMEDAAAKQEESGRRKIPLAEFYRWADFIGR